MEGFVFPDDLRTGDLILVADKFEVETVLRAFQEAGWTWHSGLNPLSHLNSLIDVLGISAWNGKIGWCDKSASDEMLSTLYKRVLKASDIFQSLRNLTFDSSILRADDAIEVHSLEETKRLLAEFKREDWLWCSGRELFCFTDECLSKICCIIIDSLDNKRLCYLQKKDRDMMSRHTRVLDYSFLFFNAKDIIEDDFPDVDLSEFLE